MSSAQRWPTITALGTVQTLAWASSYYLPAMLAVPMARDLGGFDTDDLHRVLARAHRLGVDGADLRPRY